MDSSINLQSKLKEPERSLSPGGQQACNAFLLFYFCDLPFMRGAENIYFQQENNYSVFFIHMQLSPPSIDHC